MTRNRRHLITLQTLAEGAADAYGEVSRTYTKLADVWARVEEIKVDERFLGAQVNAEATDRFTFGWATELTALDSSSVIVHGGQTYDVIGWVNPDGRNRDIVVTAKRPNA